MPDKRVEEIEERLAKATPGPWIITKPNGKIWDIEIHGPTYSGLGHEPIASVSKGSSNSDENAELLASSPSDIRYLLDRVRALEKALIDSVSNRDQNWIRAIKKAGCPANTRKRIGFHLSSLREKD